jgi:hypothetical protein
MKHRYLLSLMILLLCTGSCKKFLDTTPQDFISPVNYYETEVQLTSALAGVYDILGSAYSGTILYRLGFEADEGYYARTSPNVGPQFFNHTAGHSDIAGFWKNFYTGINRANVLLANVNKNQKIDVAIRDQIRGEALFLRAYYYFMLVQNYGGVPLILEPTVSAEDTDVARATDKEVYEQILADMKEAEGLVTPITTLGYGGRVNQSAVRGILARVCLYMAGKPLKDVSKYAEARSWAKKVMDDAQAAHALNPDYSNVFIKYAADQYDIKESIWEVEYWGNRGDAYLETGWTGYVNGPASSNPLTGSGYGGVRATAKLYQTFHAEDLRRDWSIANFTYNATGPAGSKTMITATSAASLYNRTSGKFRREYEVVLPKNGSATPQNFPLLRYSDILLMFAEADNEVNKAPSAEAYNAINMVRKRAFGKLMPGATEPDKFNLSGLDYTAFFEEIVDERARELSFETMRKSDLIRWGIFVTTMNNIGNMLTQHVPTAYYKVRFDNVVDKHVIWPIPTYEMSLNPALVQNPNW